MKRTALVVGSLVAFALWAIMLYSSLFDGGTSAAGPVLDGPRADRAAVPQPQADGPGHAGGMEWPDFFRQYTWADEQRSIVNQRAMNKLLRLQNFAARAQAEQRRAQLARAPEPPASASLTLSIGEEEINAFLQHNGQALGWEQKWAPYANGIAIFFQEDQIAVSAKAKELGALMSVRLEPKLENGRLRISLVEMLRGRRPLAGPALDAHVTQARSMLLPAVEAWQHAARMDRTGRSNEDAVRVAVAKLMLAAMDGLAVDAVVFAPLDLSGHSIPLELTQLTISDRELTFTVQTMPAARRQAFLRQLREPLPAAHSLGTRG